MPNNQTITIRTTEIVKKFFAGNFKTPSAGAIIAVEAFLALRKATLFEIKGVFTLPELTALISASTGRKLIPEFQVDTEAFVNLVIVTLRKEDFCNFKIEFQPFYNKLSKLTAAQSFFLQCEIYCYLKSGLTKYEFTDILL